MLKTRPLAVPLAVMAVSLGLAACNGNDDDATANQTPTATKTITVTPSLGRVSNARVILRNPSNPAQEYGRGNLNAQGSATINIPATVSAVVAELQPLAGATYFDEAITDDPLTAANESLVPLTQNLHTAFTLSGAANASIGMTALTEAAYQRALAQAGSAAALNAAYINQANAYVQQVFNVSNILQSPVIIGSAADYANLINSSLNAASREYAMRLAALAQQARTQIPGSTQPAIDMMNALAADLQAGGLDGVGVNGNIANLPYAVNTANFAAAWATAMQAILANIQTLLTGSLSSTELQNLGNYFNTLAAQLNVTPSPVIAATPVRTVNGIAEYACSDRNNIRSVNGGATLDMDFVNNSGQSVNIDWLNTLGTAIRYRTSLVSGSNYYQNNTYVGHPWLLTNGSGACKGIFMAVTAGNKVITLNADGTSTLGVPGGSSNTEPATVNAALGGNYTLTYHQSQAGGLYSDGQQVNFSVNASTGVLSVGGMPLGNPYYMKFGGVANTAEVIWKDGNIEYALTNNTTGMFNEINISDSSKAKPFMGQFRMPAVAQTCQTTGADNKLGFNNAPTDFCGFVRGSSSAITNPDIYTFSSGDADKRILKITVSAGAVQSVIVENSTYAFGCGAGSQTACSGINFVNGANQKEFVFSNTTLDAITGSTQPLTVTGGSVIHPVAATGAASQLALPSGTILTNSATLTVTLMPAFPPSGRIMTFKQGNASATLYDYGNTLGIAAGDSGMSIGINPLNACALVAGSVTPDTPACSDVGVDFNRSTGKVTFTNTPMHAIVFTCPGSCQLSGQLGFTPY
ncbi:von Hippel-Lindau disease tumor suppressor protein [Fluviicoccus keumensis]|uniref:von Hippel-Lindau disease tumor suppressor protein n=1 Tax=Fluviicoccus keumensis TaxID=1435465 RepID=A0A4Q7Z4H8_9GAMM|nr:hypothetical protein [Fluviicoccus keumensis]RZU45207.1 von Hippel-Lindau disease tumor suppressor protein [Fluviicoccus keumensis]